MKTNLPFNSNLIRLGGIAGILAGICVLAFFIVCESKGFLFTPDIFTGGSIEPWLDRIAANAKLARIITILPIIGFSCMLVVGFVLFQMIEENSWQKSLAIVGYLIGIPIAVSIFTSHLSFVNLLLAYSSQNQELGSQIQILAISKMHLFMIVNFAIGPFFIIFIGNTLMAWTALKSHTLPKWLCYWAFFNGTLMLFGILSVIFPVFSFGQNAGPLTMLWFLTTGIILIKKSRTQ